MATAVPSNRFVDDSFDFWKAKPSSGLKEYKCPHCGGKALSGDPQTGMRYRGSAACTECGEHFSVVRMSFDESKHPRDDGGQFTKAAHADHLAEASEYGKHFQTGKPVSFTYARNTEKAPKRPAGQDPFQQQIEPAGRYLTHKYPDAQLPAGWETGEVSFKNPLVVKQTLDTDRIYGDKSWKQNLSRHLGGKKGKHLSKAVADAGHDGIVTVDERGNTSEIVDLTGAMRMAQDDAGRWITIGGGEAGGAKHAGGTPVMIDKHGAIIGGPDALVGKSLDNLSGDGDFEVDGDKSDDETNSEPKHPRHEKRKENRITDYVPPGKEKPSWSGKAHDQRTPEEQEAAERAYREDDERYKRIAREEVAKVVTQAEKVKKIPDDPSAMNHDVYVAANYRKELAKARKDSARLTELSQQWDEVRKREWSPEQRDEMSRLNDVLESKPVVALLRRYPDDFYAGETEKRKKGYIPELWQAEQAARRHVEALEYRLENGHWQSEYTGPGIKESFTKLHEAATRKKFEETGVISDENLRHYWWKGDWIKGSEHGKKAMARHTFLEWCESGREDAKSAATKHRLKEFEEKAEPIIKTVRQRVDAALKDASEQDNRRNILTAAIEKLENESLEASRELGVLDHKYGYTTSRIIAMRRENKPLYGDWEPSDKRRREELIAHNQRRRDQLIEAQKELRENAAGKASRRWLAKHFGLKEKGTVDARGGALNDLGRENLAEAKDFIEQFFDGKVTANIENLKPSSYYGEDRAYAQNDTMHIRGYENTPTIIHELGHIIDHQDGNRIGRFSKAFLWKHLGENPNWNNGEEKNDQGLSSYFRPDEIMDKNGFSQPYVGKWYRGDSSEVMSMGLQLMYEDAIKFARESPEHFAYTIAALQEI